jgi:MerR family transcriptional regulator, copper efflux regulator
MRTVKSAATSASVTVATAEPARPRATADATVAAPAAAAKRSSGRRTIAQAAREAGVGVETVRYYERQGLIPRPADGAGYRHYPDATVERIQFIRHAADHGFALREIAELLGWVSSGESSCAEMCGRIDRKIAEIDGKIGQLTNLRNHLSAIVAQSPRQGAAENCKVMECFRGEHDCSDI